MRGLALARIDVRNDLPQPLGDLRAQTKDARRNTSCDRLARDKDIGLQAMELRIAARPARDGMRLVDDQNSTGPPGDIAHRPMKFVIDRDDAEIRHQRLGQYAGDVVLRQGCFESVDIVELDDPGYGVVVYSIGMDHVAHADLAV